MTTEASQTFPPLPPSDHPERNKRCRRCDRTNLTSVVPLDAGDVVAWADHDLCTDCQDRAERATAAAHSAVEAASELLRYAREGNDLNGRFAVECVERLIDAAKMAAEVDEWPADKEERGQVYAAIATFLEGWVP